MPRDEEALLRKVALNRDGSAIQFPKIVLLEETRARFSAAAARRPPRFYYASCQKYQAGGGLQDDSNDSGRNRRFFSLRDNDYDRHGPSWHGLGVVDA